VLTAFCYVRCCCVLHRRSRAHGNTRPSLNGRCCCCPSPHWHILFACGIYARQKQSTWLPVQRTSRIHTTTPYILQEGESFRQQTRRRGRTNYCCPDHTTLFLFPWSTSPAKCLSAPAKHPKNQKHPRNILPAATLHPEKKIKIATAESSEQAMVRGR
ncbi:unnamed protein product, partial [Ectocarpus fasciculatus]